VQAGPTIQFYTGLGSEETAAALYCRPQAAGSGSDYMVQTMQGPVSVRDSSRVNVALYSTRADDSTLCNGQLQYDSGAGLVSMLSWDGTGVRCSSLHASGAIEADGGFTGDIAASTLSVDGHAVTPGQVFTSIFPISTGTGWEDQIITGLNELVAALIASGVVIT
jgi:hypothetical protein